ncbi:MULTISPECIES: alkane 1-monooxygenase [Streptomyces]|uniref:Alkane 1-monooxygenase n=1 Tax=Streptomyces albus (strain ATCC 21838 / DSM 41398 / FERM P-419 / JCM 4703 / NBRC 107858) TaxID=1081613 RepID=A0A0B5EPT6_STRA4|nr:alkane 1-monooxygenase [Streptomyces sp. SCSIO ZS0520]AJE81285.1 Alkane 1-monooxygenase [Streptomyces albus]AOU75600.1 Alkane 1-monooxygenase [Streptomyces albus]AYN31405.1 alkane 1-monooxygenase [Streptomyces albus]
MSTTGGSGTATDVTWRDPKRYLWLIGLVVPLFPFIAWGLVEATGVGLLWWTGILLLYVIFPVVDILFGKDSANPPESATAWLEQDRYYRWCIYLYLPVQYAGLVFGCWLLTHGDLSFQGRLGLAITLGGVAGIGINTAHELGHKKESVERWLSKVALAQTCYGHFFIEHNRGHHVRVATPEDPASARLGESFWAFWPRTVSGSLRSAWHLEKKRMERLGKSPWSPRNDVLNAWVMSAVLFGALVLAFGPGLLPWLALQAVFGFSLLEVINYTEHYGLLRRHTESGRYERCAPRHSWNSDNVASNVFLYHLQRHSDHHANPTRRYQALRHFEEAPELPTGYAGMIVLAYFPPLWRRVMDHRVLAHYGGDINRANLHPGKREALLTRYGSAV